MGVQFNWKGINWRNTFRWWGGVAILAVILTFAIVWRQERIQRIAAETGWTQTQGELAATQEANRGLQERLDTVLLRVASLQETIEAKVQQLEAALGNLEKMARASKQLMIQLTRSQIARQRLHQKVARLEGKPLAKVREDGSVELGEILVTTQVAHGPLEGKVLVIDRRHAFIVIDMGLEHRLNTGDVLGIYRGDEFLARVMVEEVSDNVSAASIIPASSASKVEVNDSVKEL